MLCRSEITTPTGIILGLAVGSPQVFPSSATKLSGRKLLPADNRKKRDFIYSHSVLPLSYGSYYPPIWLTNTFHSSRFSIH
jgi:hypothetical protein